MIYSRISSMVDLPCFIHSLFKNFNYAWLILSGKSTTASMLAYVLKAMGDDITAVVGAHVPQVHNRMHSSGCMFKLRLK